MCFVVIRAFGIVIYCVMLENVLDKTYYCAEYKPSGNILWEKY